jgi:hypothetical protein
MFVEGDGSLWAMGDDNYGELGDGIYANNFPSYGTNLPEQIVASNVTAIAAGDSHSMFVKSDGSLWAMGWNLDGQLGDGTYNMTNLPEQIVAGNVMAIAAGSALSLFVKSDGSLWAMGYNLYGQLGNGISDLYTNYPEQIVVNPDYNRISGQILTEGKMLLSFFGNAGTNSNYALDRSFSLAPPNWIPQATNSANSFGALVFTNTPDSTTNNFWRIRSVP